MSNTPNSPILLVAGAAEDEELWTDVIVGLPESRTLALPNSSDLKLLTESVLVALREATRDRTERAVLVGHSLGGAMCVLAAQREPGLVSSVVVVASGASMPVHHSLWDLIEADGEAAVISRFAAATAGGGSDSEEPAGRGIAQRMQAMMQRAVPGTLTNHLKACDAYQAPTVPLASTVVAGARDRLVCPDLSEELSQRIGARYELVPDAGHQIPWERPDSVVSAVLTT